MVDDFVDYYYARFVFMSDIAAIKELNRELVSFYLSLRFEIHGRVEFTAKRLIEIGVFLLTIVA